MNTTITRADFLSLWDSKARSVPREIATVSAEMEDSAKTPWGEYDVCSAYLDPALAKFYKIDEPTPGCKAYSLGVFQQTERYALQDYRLDGAEAWWGPDGVHERTKRGELDPRDYLLKQMRQYDTEMGRRLKLYTRMHGANFVAIAQAFRSYNGSGLAAERYSRKAMGFLAKVKEDLGNV